MKILSAEQIKKADKETIERQGISSLDLMERAGTKIFEEIHKNLKGSSVSVKIFCGIGNNGGDGLVLARLLLENGYKVSVFIVDYKNKRSEDFVDNYQRFIELNKEWPVNISPENHLPEIDPKDRIVDAIFGIGLNRSLQPWVAELIEHINSSKAFVLSVDLPSGVFMNKALQKEETAIKANLTLTFQVLKLVFFLPHTAKYAGEIKLLDIGLDKEFLKSLPAVARFIGKREALKIYVPRKKFSHKGHFGHALLAGGSYGKIGSITMTAEAALRAGAGLATVFIPKCGYEILQAQVPEAMVLTDSNDKHLENIIFDFEPSVICFGVGVGKKRITKDAFLTLLKNTKKPMLIDADGLNLLAENKELLQDLPENSVLTPHPKELERLIGQWKDDFEKIELAKEFSTKNKIILVIKGAYTLTVSSNDLYINSTGNAGMATAGSGDVLSGIITGLISAGYKPLEAAIFGVYLHGKAGDFAARKMSQEAMIAGDITTNLGAAFLDLLASEEK